ncbi:universal stress protein [Pontibacter silvestris]|nr:universal stress protein [Pontibacter silvestris]
MANLTRSKLLLVHVLPMQVLTATESPMYITPIPLLKEFYSNKLHEQVKQIQLENGFRFEVGGFCEHGPFNQLINELVVSEQVDLIVMGTRGANSLLDSVFGTTTASFIKAALCPVLAVPAGTRLLGLKKIAYASDFANEDEIFLKQLFHFAAPFGSEINIVNVNTGAHQHHAIDEHLLQHIAGQYPNNRFSVAKVKATNVAAGLRTFVNENNINLLAVSIHERSVVEDFFHKSLTKQLALNLTTPLLSLPEKPYKLQNVTLLQSIKTIVD